MKINFGEIWIADLNPRIGTEPGKCRPVLVIQNQALLDVNHPSTLIIPITTNLIDDVRPLRIRIKKIEGLTQDSDLLIDQVRAIDNIRLKKMTAKIDDDFMEDVIDNLLEIIG